MPTRLRRLINPSDSESQQLGKLTEALVPGLDYDIRRQVTATATDTPSSAEDKWRRAVTESLASLREKTAAGARQFTFAQDAPADVWDITHNLGGFPSVTVVDSGNSVGFGEVQYMSPSRLLVTFSAGFSGKAYLVL